MQPLLVNMLLLIVNILYCSSSSSSNRYLYIYALLMAIFYIILNITCIMYFGVDILGTNCISSCSPNENVSNVQYWQEQTEMYRLARDTLSIPEYAWSDEQRMAVEELKSIGEYNKEAIAEGLKENRNGLRDVIKKELPKETHQEVNQEVNSSLKRERDSSDYSIASKHSKSN